MCTHPFAKGALTLHLARGEGHKRYFDCNLMHRKVLASSHQHLMAEAPRHHRLDPARECARADWVADGAVSSHPVSAKGILANLRRLVKRILRRHGYPPDKQEKATRTVLEQAEVLSAGWAA